MADENPNLDPKAFWKISYGLYAVTSAFEGKINCQIANTVIQVTAAPPRIAVALNKNNFTHGLISKSGIFSVSILDQEAPMPFIGLLGFKSGKDTDKMSQVNIETGPGGCPCVTDHSLSILEAKVIATLDVGTHTIFVGDVVAGKVLKDGTPLTYDYYQEVKNGKASANAPTYKGDHAPEVKEKPAPSGKYRCKVCGYIYDPEKGDPDGRIKPGVRFEDLPANWVCPVCGAKKEQFEPV